MRWAPRATAEEKRVADGLRPASKFYRFLWENRLELCDEEFQRELAASYDPRGQEPCVPALLAMVMLLQRYDGVSDADAVDAAENDRRWQLVLGTLGLDKAPFGQGTLVRFRVRAISNDLDRKLVDRTVELAKKTKQFGWKKLRVALDSSPLSGAGRVEDTWNLIGRAMSRVVHAVGVALDLEEEQVIKQAKVPVLSGDSIKAALDIDWDDDDAKFEALQLLVSQAEALDAWVVKRAKEKAEVPPIKGALDLLRSVVAQDLEPDPSGHGQRIREGVAENRIVSISDPEMRHGRKSRSQVINGYKRHVTVANGFILKTAVRPANDAEHEATPQLLGGVERHGKVTALDIDRGYLASPLVAELHRAGTIVNSRPWVRTNQGRYTKYDFEIDLRRQTVTCPAGKQAPIRPSGSEALFQERDCSRCKQKASCTTAAFRTIKIHPAEGLLIRLRVENKTKQGREQLRTRVVVEHKLARVEAVQGTTARYRGVRMNELDLNRTAAVINLLEVSRLRRAA
jgi:IS5 family transposase